MAMRKRPTYRVLARRSGAWWAIQVREVDGVFSQARRLDQVEAMARDAISLMLEVPEDSFDLDVVVSAPESLGSLVDEYRRERDVADKSSHRATELAREIVAKAEEEHLTVRDLGELMGLSFQRVQQIRSSQGATARKASGRPRSRRTAPAGHRR